LAWLLNEKGGGTVSKILKDSVLPSSALTESLYRARELGSSLGIEELYAAIVGAGVKIEPVTEADSVRAAELIEISRRTKKANGASLSLGDGLCIAVGERLNLVITGGDIVWGNLNLKVEFHPFR